MSRIGKQPIRIPNDATIDLKDDKITVTGPKGKLQKSIHSKINVGIDKDQIIITVNDNTKESKSLHGLYRVLINNMIIGVTKSFKKTLDIVAIGYRVEKKQETIIFNIGYSHPVVYNLPDGIDAKIEKTRITLSSIDKELLGKTAALIRNFRPPEPYKGKGIRYQGEIIRRKAGKVGAK